MSIVPPFSKGYAEKKHVHVRLISFSLSPPLFFYIFDTIAYYVCIPMCARKGFYLITRGIIHYYER